MKTILKKYVSLTIMVFLLILVVSLLPQEGTVTASTGSEQPINSAKSLSLLGR